MFLKYEKIILHIKESVSCGLLNVGDPLPSINSVCAKFNTARDTVVKAYKVLKDDGLIESKPGKGFFLIRSTTDFKPTIFLLLNSFNPYMEVLYNGFKQELGENYKVDVFFHHNNIEVFRTLITENRGKYHSYVIKPFLCQDVPQIIDMLEDEYILIIDRDDFIQPSYSYLCQDFSKGFLLGLKAVLPKLKRYNNINYLHSKKNPHPLESEEILLDFCKENSLKLSIRDGVSPTFVNPKEVYIVLSDDEMLQILTICKEKNLIIGRDVGIISYNDNPMNKFISGGITAISTDFNVMGSEAAYFSKHRKPINKINPTRLIQRNSI